jgi:hypothetical protein
VIKLENGGTIVSGLESVGKLHERTGKWGQAFETEICYLALNIPFYLLIS